MKSIQAVALNTEETVTLVNLAEKHDLSTELKSLARHLAHNLETSSQSLT